MDFFDVIPPAECFGNVEQTMVVDEIKSLFQFLIGKLPKTAII